MAGSDADEVLAAVVLAQLVTVAAAVASAAAAAVCSAAFAASAAAAAVAVVLTLLWPRGVRRRHSRIRKSHPPPCRTDNSRAVRLGNGKLVILLATLLGGVKTQLQLHASESGERKQAKNIYTILSTQLNKFIRIQA